MILIGVNTNDSADINSAMNSYFATGNMNFPYKVLKGLTFNKGWQAIVVLDYDVDLDSNLIKYLSQSLDTKVLGFESVDTVMGYTVYLYEKGELQDELVTVDFEVSDAGGYFSDLEETLHDDFNPNEILDKYFKVIGFDPNSEEILTNIN